MKDSFDVIIIGGGVIGLALARELHRLGAGRIAIIERGRPGCGASHAAAGMLTPNAECEAIDDFYRLCDGSRRRFPGFANELLAETGINIELDRSGTLYAAFSEHDAQHLALKFARQVSAGIPVEHLSGEETLRSEPRLSPNVRESLYFPNDWQVENRKMVSALETYASLNGIELIPETAVESLIVEAGKVKGALASSSRFYAGVTVLATGAWTSLIKIGDVPMPFEVRPVRGQIVSFRPSMRLFSRVVYSPRGYLVPRTDGRVLIGATVEDAGFDDRVTEEAVEQLKAAAYEIAPCLTTEPMPDSWSGLRPCAADGLPVIGNVEDFDGLFAATAHYRNGILLAPITAKLLANRIVHGTMSEYFTLFGPNRFRGKGVNAWA